jgi:hypothetical protein
VPARQYLLQVLPTALEALNFYSEAQRKGYVRLTCSAHASVARVRAPTGYSSNCRQGQFSETPDSPGPSGLLPLPTGAQPVLFASDW